jgi:hypothetical protein
MAGIEQALDYGSIGREATVVRAAAWNEVGLADSQIHQSPEDRLERLKNSEPPIVNDRWDTSNPFEKHLADELSRSRTVLVGMRSADNYWSLNTGLMAYTVDRINDPKPYQIAAMAGNVTLLHMVALSRLEIPERDPEVEYWGLGATHHQLRAPLTGIVLTEMRKELGIEELYRERRHDAEGVNSGPFGTPGFPGIGVDDVANAIVDGTLTVGAPYYPIPPRL